jgi:hypothetical protein
MGCWGVCEEDPSLAWVHRASTWAVEVGVATAGVGYTWHPHPPLLCTLRETCMGCVGWVVMAVEVGKGGGGAQRGGPTIPLYHHTWLTS